MTQMDDMQKIMVDNAEFKQAVEQAGQALTNDGVHKTQMDGFIQPDNIANNNESTEPELYRSLNSDKGNMNGLEIPDSVKQQAINITQMDNIIEAQHESEISAPAPTPAINNQDNEIER